MEPAREEEVPPVVGATERGAEAKAQKVDVEVGVPMASGNESEHVFYHGKLKQLKDMPISDQDMYYFQKQGVAIKSDHKWIWKLLAYLGPGFLVCIAYIDPGNFQSDLSAGGQFGYSLLWVLLLATVFGLLIQLLSSRLGVVTGRHLAQHCRAEYSRYLTILSWIAAEVAVIAADIPEVIGTATALGLLTGVKLWIGVIICGFSTFAFLLVQALGVRKLEVGITILVMIMLVAFMIQLAEANPNVGQLFLSMVNPRLLDSTATFNAISLLGANVMPHNLFLHSGLVLSRQISRNTSSIKEACLFNVIEVVFAMTIAYVINVGVIGTAAAVCSNTQKAELLSVCQNMDIHQIPQLLRGALGSSAPTIFAIALLASGQSSTVTATYAGEFIMQGFLEIRIPRWMRNLVTRLVALVPALLVSVTQNENSSATLINACSSILSFCLPFALLPLLKFTSSEKKMGPFKNSLWLSLLVWAIGVATVGLNIYFLMKLWLDWATNSSNGMGLAWTTILSILIGLFVAYYYISLIYIAFRPVRVVTDLPIIDDMLPLRQPVSQEEQEQLQETDISAVVDEGEEGRQPRRVDTL